MLNPGNQSTIDTSKINKEELMEYVHKYHLFEHDCIHDLDKAQNFNQKQVENQALE